MTLAVSAFFRHDVFRVTLIACPPLVQPPPGRCTFSQWRSCLRSGWALLSVFGNKMGASRSGRDAGQGGRPKVFVQLQCWDDQSFTTFIRTVELSFFCSRSSPVWNEKQITWWWVSNGHYDFLLRQTSFAAIFCQPLTGVSVDLQWQGRFLCR